MLGTKIKDLRTKNNLTLKALGEIIKVGESTVSMYESEKRQPSYDILQKIANYFNVTTDYLLGNETPTKEDDFLDQAKAQYGYKGKKEAKEVMDDVQALFHGGELPEEDKDEFFKIMTEIYFDSKEKAKKYGRKKMTTDNE